MSKIGFLFPGQGSQFVGMGQEIYADYPEAREVFDEAESISKFSLKKLCFEGPEEELKQTQYTQPAIFVHSIAVDKLIKQKGLSPQAVAGHSLGEYSALVSAGALTFADGLRLVQIRGQLMQVSGEKNPGTMAAIIGLRSEEIEHVCREASEQGIVNPANFNSPGQIVISGDIPAVHEAMNIAKQRGARLTKELVVSGAFHSPLMNDALEGLIQALKEVKIETANVPVYSNAEAAPVTDPEKIRELLQKQLLSPVLWENILHNMIADGYQRFLEVGPGKVLQGLLKRTNRGYNAETIGTTEELQKLNVD